MNSGYLAKPGPIGRISAPFPSRKLADLMVYSPRPYSTIEIELTTRCNLYCPSCPRTCCSSSWIDRDLSLACFEKIAHCFEGFEVIHFHGWGEPTLNEHFPEMVRLAYQSGARLMLTTNGASKFSMDLLPYFDTIFFRLDYGLAGTYERRNPHAKFNRVVFHLGQVLHHRDHLQNKWPRIVVQFVRNRHSLKELPAYLETAIRFHPDQVVFYSPNFHLRPVDCRAQLPGDTVPEQIERIEKVLIERSRAAAVPLEILSDTNQEDSCTLGPPHNLFVDSSGRLAPCRNLSLPLAGNAFVRYVDGQAKVVDNVALGTLTENTLDRILRKKKNTLWRLECAPAHEPTLNVVQGGHCDPGQGSGSCPGTIQAVRQR